jgi:hypothetical protein
MIVSSMNHFDKDFALLATKANVDATHIQLAIASIGCLHYKATRKHSIIICSFKYSHKVHSSF